VKPKAMRTMGSAGAYKPPPVAGLPRVNMPKPGRVGKMTPSVRAIKVRKPPSKRP